MLQKKITWHTSWQVTAARLQQTSPSIVLQKSRSAHLSWYILPMCINEWWICATCSGKNYNAETFSTSVEAKCCYHSSLHNIVVWSPTWSVSQPKNCDGTSIPSVVSNLLNLWNVNYKFQECWWFIWKNGACPWGTVLQKAGRSSKLDNFQSLLVFHLQWQYYSNTCNPWKLITYCNLSTFRGN